MAVMMQAFYWDAPIKEQKEGEWWNFLSEKAPELAAAGINALWLPPICKAAEARSPGYDPYDYFDLGDFDQKGATKTLYGNRKELESLIGKLREHKESHNVLVAQSSALVFRSVIHKRNENIL